MRKVNLRRQSNIELLRIIAMLMILGLHVNFLALGTPDIGEISNMPMQSFMRILCENFCIVGVNVFVLISGWFGINYKLKGLCSFLFQSLFFSLAIFVPFCLFDKIEASRINIMSAFLMYKNAYWFVWAYFILYIISPILNTFIENTDKATIRRVIILFFTTQTVLFVFTSVGFYKAGYSPLSFIGLYLLARYFKLYRNNNGKYKYLGVYLVCVLFNTLICFVPSYFVYDNGTILSIVNSYTNPLNIIGALYILLFFTKINFYSGSVNWFAASCFAVYLVHFHFCLIRYYVNYAKDIFNNFSGITYFAIIIAFISGVFIISVLIDKVRIPLFNYIWNKFDKLRKTHQ